MFPLPFTNPPSILSRTSPDKKASSGAKPVSAQKEANHVGGVLLAGSLSGSVGAGDLGVVAAFRSTLGSNHVLQSADLSQRGTQAQPKGTFRPFGLSGVRVSLSCFGHRFDYRERPLNNLHR
jgi:hypothetical protein